MKTFSLFPALAAMALCAGGSAAFALNGNEDIKNLPAPPAESEASVRDKKIQILCQTLKDMGRGDIAQELQKGYVAGTVKLQTFPSDSSTIAETRHSGIVLNEAKLGMTHTVSPKTGKAIDKGLGVSGALTVLHEYVHYHESQQIYKETRNPLDFNSYQPDQVPKWENKAWTQTIVESKKWTDKLKSDIENIDKEGLAPKEKQERLARLKDLTKELSDQNAGLKEGLAGQIKEGCVDGEISAHGGRLQEDLNGIIDQMTATSQDALAKVNAALAASGQAKDKPADTQGAGKDAAKAKEAREVPISSPEKPAGQIATKDQPAEKTPQAPAGKPPQAPVGKAPPSAQADQPDMQGSYSGTVKMADDTIGSLSITVEGGKVTGSFSQSYNKDLGPATVARHFNAPISGNVDLSSGALEMQAQGSITATVTTKPSKPVKGFDNTPPPPVTNTMQGTWSFSGSHAGSGFSGTTEMPWSVSRGSGPAKGTAQAPADKPAAAKQPEVPGEGGTLTAADGSRTVLTYRLDASGKKVPVTTEYGRDGRVIRRTTVDSKGQTVPVK